MPHENQNYRTLVRGLGIALIVLSLGFFVVALLYFIYALFLPGLYIFNDSGSPLPDIDQTMSHAFSMLSTSGIVLLLGAGSGVGCINASTLKKK